MENQTYFGRIPTVDSDLLLEPFSGELVQKVSQLFQTDVIILDEKGTIVAECRDVEEPSGSLISSEQIEGAQRIPFFLNGWAGDIVLFELPEDIVISSELTQAIVEMAINEIVLRNDPPRIPEQIAIKNQFIYDLLQGEIENAHVIYERATQLGFDLQPPRAVLLIDAANYIKPKLPVVGHQVGVQEQHRAQSIIRSITNYFNLPSDLICAYLGNGEIVVLKAADSRNLAAWVDNANGHNGNSWANLAAVKRAAKGLLDHLPGGPESNFHIAIGRFHPGLKGLAKSYEDARAALSLGRRFDERGQVYCLDELGVHAFVGVPDEGTKVDLAFHLLSPLDDQLELMETLSVFFAENNCPSEVANKLYIHRNTVAYRLDKIASLTGLDPRRFDDAVQMQLALVLRSMQASQ
jgi:carbohydrate diacid regulator